jgi:hypothetical protein
VTSGVALLQHQLQVGYRVGFRVGFKVGFRVGYRVGYRVGFRVGFRVGYRVGFRVGFRVGLGVVPTTLKIGELSFVHQGGQHRAVCACVCVCVRIPFHVAQHPSDVADWQAGWWCAGMVGLKVGLVSVSISFKRALTWRNRHNQRQPNGFGSIEIDALN